MLACAHTDVDLVSKFALGLRYRLQKEAYRMAGWKVVIPRHALVETVCRMLAPVQHGVKTRGQCMVCAQRRPITLHWTSAAFRDRPYRETTDMYIAAMCRSCAGKRAFARAT